MRSGKLPAWTGPRIHGTLPERTLQWRKQGLVIRPTGGESMRSHAMVPVAEPCGGDVWRVYFSGRDERNRSLISYAEIRLRPPFEVLRFSARPVLGLGKLGCFDDNGVTPSWILDVGGRKYLYYIGWNSGSTVRMHLYGGLAISDDGGETFHRYSEAPVLERTRANPYLNTAPCVLREGDRWRLWYVSGVGWIHADLPRYNIQYAESTDGLHWSREGTVCVDFATADEHALARPCVVPHEGGYAMWFSYRSRDGEGYRIGVAFSEDGLVWRRRDDLSGIEPSPEGWDSELVCYAYVLQHSEQLYMLYNGNGYGREGIGLAVADLPWRLAGFESRDSRSDP